MSSEAAKGHLLRCYDPLVRPAHVEDELETGTHPIPPWMDLQIALLRPGTSKCYSFKAKAPTVAALPSDFAALICLIARWSTPHLRSLVLAEGRAAWTDEHPPSTSALPVVALLPLHAPSHLEPTRFIRRLKDLLGCDGTQNRKDTERRTQKGL